MTGGVKLLAGGNPQIPKGEGEPPVQAYIAATPGWKQAVVRQLDELITSALPGVRKAVKWNSPLYGAPGGDTWFASLHGYDRYVKVAFFDGVSLEPVPPVASKTPRARYVHVHQGDTIEAEQFTSWVKQAASLPGEKM